jgi:intracellular sulfur oxidation DsrE/DsrF family protein
MGSLKVIFHVNEVERWDVAIGNITNLISDAGEGAVEAIVLANGHAVAVYADAAKVEKMKDFSEKGVHFLACRNSLKKMCLGGAVCINEANLPYFVTVVPAGITVIIRKQHEGYAYVKP